MKSNRKGFQHRGQAMTEFIIVIPVLILLIFGTIQIAFIYSAKQTLNYATFQSARLAAVNHASYSAMRRGLIRGLAPLYTVSDDLSGVDENIRDGSNSDDGKRDSQSEVDGYTRIIRLSPRAEAFSNGSNGAGVENDDGIMEIPNDNLMYRDSSVDVGDVNIQDANLLKIRVQYCYKLMVPIVNKIIGSLSELNNRRPASAYHTYDTVGDPRFADHNKGYVDDAAALSASLADYDELCAGDGDEDRSVGRVGFILSSEAIVRMQTPAMEEDIDEEYETTMCNGEQMVCP
jgi:TadE-like protein